jgi:hypothetical protein
MQRGAALLIFALGIVTGVGGSVLVAHSIQPVQAQGASPNRTPSPTVDSYLPIPLKPGSCDSGPTYPCTNTISDAAALPPPYPGLLNLALIGMPSIAGGNVCDTTCIASLNTTGKRALSTNQTIITLYEARDFPNNFGHGSGVRLKQSIYVPSDAKVVTCVMGTTEGPC